MPDRQARRGLLRLAAAGALTGLAGVAGTVRPACAADALPRLGDLAAAAREAGPGEPVIVLVSTPGCPHCRGVRDAYLRPRAAAGAVVREIELAGRAPVSLAGGRSESEAALARALGVSLAPSVVLLDGTGALLAPALVGSDSAGFYDAYLEARVAMARQRLRNTAR